MQRIWSKKHFNAVVAFSALLVLMGGSVRGEIVDGDCAREVAANFIQKDALGHALLVNRSVRSVGKRGNLWVAHLSPSGYVVIAGSDTLPPILAFSDRAFVESDAESTFAYLLKADSDRCASRESAAKSLKAASPSTAEVADAARVQARKNKWAQLRTTKQGVPLANAIDVPTSQIVVGPFLQYKWNQWQPYNDYMPVHGNSANLDLYRGRCPCGCTITAAAQVFAYWEWPVYADESRTASHTYSQDYAGTQSKTIYSRFNGMSPLAYDNLAKEDIGKYYENGCDMRGAIAEEARFPIARLVSLVNNLADIVITPGGSSASFSTIASRARWYENVREVLPSENYAVASKVSGDALKQKIPLVMTIPYSDGGYHTVVGHGWADDGTMQYVYTNYGWSGDNDGWYVLDQVIDGRKTTIYAGFAPRKTVQLDPLPKVVDNADLSWHLPKTYAQDVQGFDVRAYKLEWKDAAALSLANNPTGVFKAGESKACEIGGAYVLTDSSVLSFDVESTNMLNHILKVQVQCDGEWQTLTCSRLNSFNWLIRPSSVSCWLGAYSGERARLRVVFEHDAASLYSDGRVLIKNLTFSNVLGPGTPESVRVSKNARSYTWSGMDAGETYAFSVQPVGSGSEESAFETTTKAGYAARPRQPKEDPTITDFSMKEKQQASYWTCVASSASGEEIVTYPFDGGFFVSLPGWFTDKSTLAFDLATKSYLEKSECSDDLEAYFIDTQDAKTELWRKSSRENIAKNRITIDLSKFKGMRGTVAVYYRHQGPQFTEYGYGATFSDVKLTNVRLAEVFSGAVLDSVQAAASAPVRINAVSSDKGRSESGFYFACARGWNRFAVACSANVTTLKARSSQPSVLGDDRIAIGKCDNGLFEVYVDGSGIGLSQDRTRLIVTLVAKDANGTRCAKDLSLRFSSETQAAALSPYLIRFVDSTGVHLAQTLACRRDRVYELPRMGRIANGNRFAGWRCSNGKRYDDGVMVFNLAGAGETVRMTAIWE